jgi:hypothetical protein
MIGLLAMLVYAPLNTWNESHGRFIAFLYGLACYVVFFFAS